MSHKLGSYDLLSAIKITCSTGKYPLTTFKVYWPFATIIKVPVNSPVLWQWQVPADHSKSQSQANM